MVEKIAVVANKVLIEPISEQDDQITAGGVVLPDSVKKDATNAKIVAVGPEADKRLKIGTKVAYDSKAGAQIDTMQRKLYLMRDIDLLYFFQEEIPSLN